MITIVQVLTNPIAPNGMWDIGIQRDSSDPNNAGAAGAIPPA